MKPAEFYFLKQPYFSKGSEMIKYTLQDLCIRDVLDIEGRKVLLNKNDTKRFLRFYFSKGPEFKTADLTDFEQLIVEPLLHVDLVRFYKIRKHLMRKLDKAPNRFKAEYIYPSANEQDLIRWYFFPTSKAKAKMRDIQTKIDWLDSLEKNAIPKNEERVLAALVDLGSNILFLKKETIKNLDVISSSIQKISKLYFLTKNSRAFNDYNTYDSIGSFGDFSGTSGGDFGGFGGGDFGGGGAGGSW